MTYDINKNEQYETLEISFQTKPDENVRAALKENGFRWHGVKKVWYGRYSSEAELRNLIDGFVASTTPSDELVIPESRRVDEGTLYEGWEGGNRSKWRSEKELKALLLADFKKAGIKASIRFRRAGYLTALTVTMTISSGDIISLEEWSERGPRLYGRSWLPYTDDAGNYKEIHDSKFFALPAEEREELAPRIFKQMYTHAVESLSESGTVPAEDVLTEDARKRYDLVKRIVNSYNSDCSNSMIDYFDRSIYDNYTFKIVDPAV